MTLSNRPLQSPDERSRLAAMPDRGASVRERQQQEVIVVGNGAIGASIAFELRRRGFGITRIGQRHRPYAASVAAGAMLGCFGEVTQSLLASEHGRAKLDMDYRARQYWTQWDEQLSDG